jgi:hypothetical protein
MYTEKDWYSTYWHVLLCNTCQCIIHVDVNTCQYIPVHELGDHISEKASTSCIRIGAAMRIIYEFHNQTGKWKDHALTFRESVSSLVKEQKQKKFKIVSYSRKFVWSMDWQSTLLTILRCICKERKRKKTKAVYVVLFSRQSIV